MVRLKNAFVCVRGELSESRKMGGTVNSKPGLGGRLRGMVELGTNFLWYVCVA